MKTSLMTGQASCLASLDGYKMHDNAISQEHRKRILSDPVAAFSDANSDVDIATLHQLEKHQAEIITLMQHADETLLQSKKISRQIGENKRNKLDITHLMASMQQLSKKQKELSAQIAEQETSILKYFTEDDSDTARGSTEPLATSEDNITQRPSDESITTDGIIIKRLTENNEAWNDYVDRNPSACIHHRYEWQKILKESYGHQCFYFAAYDKTQSIVGILPLVHLQSRLFGNLLVSMPYFQRAGAIADHPLIEQALVKTANSHAETSNIEHIEYRDDIIRQAMPSQTHKVNMVLELPVNKDLLWRSFTSKLRSQIKRPQRENTETLIGSSELLEDFYKVYARNMRDLGSPPHSKTFIKNILESFPDNCWLIVIKLHGKAVAGGFLLAYKDTMEIPLASTVRDVNHLSINMLLYWQVLKFSIELGYRFFDFGRSTKGAGTYRFKKQWGAKEKPLYWHYWLNDGTKPPSLNPANPKFALVIYLWKRLPVKISQLLGPHIVKNIP